MNSNMWENAITQENVAKLRKHGYNFVEPAEGELACGYEGKGRLPEPHAILEYIMPLIK
jgi:phosphopantothenoylcysteine decarboxylase/phosphopantothenate--cysteine ligase